ncbi:hypothetical protein AB9P05_21435 [Roseivirga sp. BDSF3-8]|uniref:hypothetical protein n=1 Tax=Roseivirga sp. BDSF3-8 TaxID=3241598 RepID=UPI00353208BB
MKINILLFLFIACLSCSESSGDFVGEWEPINHRNKYERITIEKADADELRAVCKGRSNSMNVILVPVDDDTYNSKESIFGMYFTLKYKDGVLIDYALGQEYKKSNKQPSKISPN